ncbi:hypothetical protein HID58_081891, partial [Brassica napus]
ITTCIDSTPLTITHSMIRTPLPSGEAPKSWVGEKPLLSVSTFFQQPPPPRSSISGKDEQMAKTDMAVSSSATLADSQCMEAAEVIRAEKEHLASVVRTAISVRCARDIMTLTACVPQNIVKRSGDIESEGYDRSLEYCISVYSDKELITSEGCSNISNCSNGSSSSSHNRELIQGDNFLVISGREWLARGCQLLKRSQGKEDYLLFLV